MAGIINLNNTTPAPPSGNTNVEWQGDSSTPRNVSAYLPNMVGDSGSGGTAGAVPSPAAGAAAAGKFLKADGTWAVPPSGGLAGATVKTASYTAVAADSNTLVAMNSGSASFTARKPRYSHRRGRDFRGSTLPDESSIAQSTTT